MGVSPWPCVSVVLFVSGLKLNFIETKLAIIVFAKVWYLVGEGDCVDKWMRDAENERNGQVIIRGMPCP